MSLALTNHTNNIELVLLKEVLELAAYALGYDGRQFYSQVPKLGGVKRNVIGERGKVVRKKGSRKDLRGQDGEDNH